MFRTLGENRLKNFVKNRYCLKLILCESQIAKISVYSSDYDYITSTNKRNDDPPDLLDALCCGTLVCSIIEYSLSCLFRRDYGSLYKVIQDYQPEKARLNQFQLAARLPKPQNRPFWLLGLDVTPNPLVHAFKLEGQECVYQTSSIRGDKRITYGHQHSFISQLPERKRLYASK
jgi:hypothetical protein